MNESGIISDYLAQKFHPASPKQSLPLDVVDGIIEWFENVRIRPQMFFGDVTYQSIGNGLYWFHMAFRHLSFEIDPKFDVGKARGWKSNAMGYLHDFQRKGLSEEEMADELLVIEIESWKRLREKLLATPKE